MRIVLVRHAAPEVVADVDPRRWRLSEGGRSEARRLRARLPAAGVWVSSTEPKAYETLRCAAGAGTVVAQDAGFDEVRREEPFDEDFRVRRRAWVEGRLDERHAGWETPVETAERFDRAIAVHLARLAHLAPASPLVVASHGMAMTAWLLHARRATTPERAGQFWSELAFPDVVEVD